MGGIWTAPGVSELTSDPPLMRLDIGEPDGKITTRLKEVQSILRLVGECVIVDNLPGIRGQSLS